MCLQAHQNDGSQEVRISNLERQLQNVQMTQITHQQERTHMQLELLKNQSSNFGLQRNLTGLPNGQLLFPHTVTQSLADNEDASCCVNLGKQDFSSSNNKAKKTQKRKKLPSELKSLPLLTSISKRKDPVVEVWNMWRQPWAHNGQQYRAIKSMCEEPRSGDKRDPGRSEAEEVKRLRYIAICIELMEAEGISNAAQVLNRWYISKRMRSLSALADKIRKELSDKKISRIGVSNTTARTLSHPLYETVKGAFFWSDLV